MRNKTLLAGAGLLSFFLFVIVNMPAALLTDRLPDTIRPDGVAGTLWRGHVRSVAIDGWRLSDVNWALHSTALLIGRLSGGITARAAGGEFDAETSISVFGAVTVSQLKASGPIAPLAEQLKLPVTGGRYQVELTNLSVENAWPVTLTGSARVIDVPFNMTGSAGGPTGSYAVEFDIETVPEDGRLSGELSDEGGPIEVSGTVVLTPPGNYSVQANVRARPGAPAEIVRALKLAGPVGADGKREISFTGSL